jgi:hypothetical protein
MKRIVKLDRNIGEDPDGDELVTVRVSMDKECFIQLCAATFIEWEQFKLGDSCFCVNFTREILKEIEMGCNENNS